MRFATAVGRATAAGMRWYFRPSFHGSALAVVIPTSISHLMRRFARLTLLVRWPDSSCLPSIVRLDFFGLTNTCPASLHASAARLAPGEGGWLAAADYPCLRSHRVRARFAPGSADQTRGQVLVLCFCAWLVPLAVLPDLINTAFLTRQAGGVHTDFALHTRPMTGCTPGPHTTSRYCSAPGMQSLCWFQLTPGH